MYDVATHIVRFCSVSPNEGTYFFARAVLALQIEPDTWLMLCHLISVVVDAGITPVESLEGPSALSH